MHAFAVDSPEMKLNAEDEALAQKVAAFVVRRQMTTPALLILETGRPFTFIGSQFLVFLTPFVSLIFSSAEYTQFVGFLEKRKSIDLLIETILDLENQAHG